MATALRVMTLGPSPQNGSPNTCVLLSTAPADSSPPQKMSVLLPAKRSSPAGESGPNSPASNDMLRCKRRITFSGSVHQHMHHHQPASVARRNARERNRVKQVNNGFATLRQHIPMSLMLAAAAERAESPSEQRSGRCGGSNSAAAKKMSKVETLRCAVEYIRSLQSLLNSENAPGSSPSQASVTSEGTSGVLGGFYGGDFASSEGSPSSTYQFPVQAPPPSSLSSPPPSSSSSTGSPSPSYASDEAPAVYTPSCGVFYESHAATPAETYEPMSPEDEELLDVISWWQQSQ
ncbi:achaete-scute homolog 1-like [Ischnura elegans]|uniref:achaete-scute homolog 1-like n=1 Tax=Ischnura elegans TaxID=197161 RepID=UPI001ED8A90E|nr:achaete-scute homolog 1-like [Ischnura elegans]